MNNFSDKKIDSNDIESENKEEMEKNKNSRLRKKKSSGNKRRCPNCGRELEEYENLFKCEKCNQVYCNDEHCGAGKGCPNCGCGGAVTAIWNPITKQWS